MTHSLPRRLFFSLLALAILFVVPASYADSIHLVILHSNDSHGCLFTPDQKDTMGDMGGLARAAAVIRETREEEPGRVLALHAGDVISRGDPLTVSSRGQVNFTAMRRAGYDFMQPGNGDFYGGVEALLESQRASGMPMVCANVLRMPGEQVIFPPYAIKTVAGVRIAILGLGFIRAEHPSGKELELRDPIATATPLMPELERQADIILLLSHLGYEEDKKLAAEVPGIGLIVGGHSHTVLAQPEHVVCKATGQGVYVAQAGEYEQYIGRMDLTIEREGDIIRLTDVKGRLIPLDASIKPDKRIARFLKKKMRPLLEPVGVLAATLPNPPEGPSPIHAWLADRMRETARANIALLDKGAASASLPAGVVTMADVWRVHPYRNHVVVVTLLAVQARALVNALPDFTISGIIPEGEGPCRVVMTDYGLSQASIPLDAPCEDTGLRVDEVVLHAIANGNAPVGG